MKYELEYILLLSITHGMPCCNNHLVIIFCLFVVFVGFFSLRANTFNVAVTNTRPQLIACNVVIMCNNNLADLCVCSSKREYILYVCVHISVFRMCTKYLLAVCLYMYVFCVSHCVVMGFLCMYGEGV